jgi:hemerythrin-like domain-containing protein
MSEPFNSLLLERQGLPDDLLWLARKYPREDWPGHTNIRGVAMMWLQRHDMFRELGGMLSNGIGDYREGRSTASEFARWFAPRLSHFLGNLDGHHNVEDHHYFPVFAKAETRLKRGFEILDADHHAIHESLERNAEAANAFLTSLQRGEDKQRFAADAYADENSRLIAMLTRHLADEEDLIIPLILDRGDEAMGID